MTVRTITFDDEQWQLVPRRLPGAMIDTINGHIDADSDAVALWRDALIDAPEPETCFCDEKGIGDPAKSCGDCPEDYGIPTVRANPEPPAQQPMTEDEIDEETRAATDALMDYIYEYGTGAEGSQQFIRRIARAVEAHHGIGKGESNAN